MKLLRAKVLLPAVCTSLLFLLPTAVSAAETTSAADGTASLAAATSHYETKVNGILVPGLFSNVQNARVALLPGGIGVTVVDKDIKLPTGSSYLD